jgi:hypothetical protein
VYPTNGDTAYFYFIPSIREKNAVPENGSDGQNGCKGSKNFWICALLTCFFSDTASKEGIFTTRAEQRIEKYSTFADQVHKTDSRSIERT